MDLAISDGYGVERAKRGSVVKPICTTSTVARKIVETHSLVHNTLSRKCRGMVGFMLKVLNGTCFAENDGILGFEMG
jgi:hypothetical protein